MKVRILGPMMGAAIMLASQAQVAQANELYFGMPINYDDAETDTVFVYGASGITGNISSPNGFTAPFTVGSDGVTSSSSRTLMI